MTDRQTLLSTIDEMCQQIEVLERRAAGYTAQAVAAQQHAKQQWDLSDGCYTKIRKIKADMDKAYAELSERKVTV